MRLLGQTIGRLVVDFETSVLGVRWEDGYLIQNRDFGIRKKFLNGSSADFCLASRCVPEIFLENFFLQRPIQVSAIGHRGTKSRLAPGFPCSRGRRWTRDGGKTGSHLKFAHHSASSGPYRIGRGRAGFRRTSHRRPSVCLGRRRASSWLRSTWEHTILQPRKI